MRIANSRRSYLVAAILAALTGSALADDHVLELAIHGAKPPAKPPVLSVLENDRVLVHLTSDQPVQVHLHGYDIEIDVAPDHPTSGERSAESGSVTEGAFLMLAMLFFASSDRHVPCFRLYRAQPHIVVTDTVDPKFTRQFDNITAVIEETRRVRVWGGIHFRNTLEVSDVMGREVAAYLVANSIRPVR